MATAKDQLWRYNLVLPKDLYEELQRVADKRNTTLLQILRKGIKLVLLADQIEDTPGAGLFIREGDSEQRILVV